MDECNLSFETLADYYEGRADAEASRRIRAHLEAGCAHCQSRLAWLTEFLPALHSATTAPEPAPSEAALAYARNLIRGRTPVPARPSLPVRIAQLLFDSRQAPALAGARGEGGQTARSLYATDDHYIDLWEERAQEGHYYLIGQVLPKAGGDPLLPESALLIQADGRTLTAQSEGTEFHVPAAPAGTYQLRLRLGAAEILMPEVVIGE
jgi:hypothetical protein